VNGVKGVGIVGAASRDPRSLAGRPSSAKELLGQVATPPEIALKMARRLLRDVQEPIALLDPCVGEGAFPAAIARAGLGAHVGKLVAIDVDPVVLARARSAWPSASGFEPADYLSWQPEEPFDAAILNPPYVRQEWLDRKEALQRSFKERYGVEVPGTSNLYVYFLVKMLEDLRPGGIFACIIYDSWQSTRFGAWLARHILQRCQDFACEAIGSQPFRGRLIDATILTGRRSAVRKEILPTLQERLPTPLGPRGPLDDVPGFAPLESLFEIRRGLRLKQASFFLCDMSERRRMGATPFVKKIARVRGYVVPRDHREAALLASSGRTDARVRQELERRIADLLESTGGEARGDIPILNWYRERPESWFAHRAPPRAPLIFNYYLRNRPRYLYNPERAYSDNFYGLTPKKGAPLAWLAALNGTAACAQVLARARNQGNGLAKLQLFEFKKVRVPDLGGLPRAVVKRLERLGEALVAGAPAGPVVEQVDACLARAFGDARLAAPALQETFERVDRSARRPRELTAQGSDGLARSDAG
jgi:hypothetical protein